MPLQSPNHQVGRMEMSGPFGDSSVGSQAMCGEEGPTFHHQAWTSRATLPQANQLKALAKPVCVGESPSGNSNLPVFALQANRAKQKCCFGTLSQIFAGLPCQQCWASPPHVTSHSSLLCDSLLPLPLKAAHHSPVAHAHDFPAGPGTQTFPPSPP